MLGFSWFFCWIAMKKIVLEHCISQRIMDPIKGKAVIKQVFVRTEQGLLPSRKEPRTVLVMQCFMANL